MNSISENLFFSNLPSLCSGEMIQLVRDSQIKHLLIDSRKSHASNGAVFFAIKGERNDGHQFISTLYQAGLRYFVIERNIDLADFPDGNFFRCQSAIDALQAIAAHHRANFHIPVVGITGSNGKTIIKEWLYQLLSRDFSIVKNPGSYNSQVGVPLSVWQIQSNHNLALFEAGISKPGEMERLGPIINPTIGIFTNIGTAHDEGFASTGEKIEEKAKLFLHSKVVIACADHTRVVSILKNKNIKTFTWGRSAQADIHVSILPDNRVHLKLQRAIQTEHSSRDQHWFRLPFSDAASLENILHCLALMMYLKIAPETIQERLDQIRSVPMRLQLKQGINNFRVIDDTYNNDFGGLQMSLDFLSGQQARRKTLIMTDILESGLPNAELMMRLQDLINTKDLTKLIAIGPVLRAHASMFVLPADFYSTTEEFLQHANWDDFNNEVILVKGARKFQLERVVQRLQRKIHGTVMEIDLDALAYNLNAFRSRLEPQTKIMVMVKAFAYGSGSVEVANLMQYQRADYLGVAYADEGVQLRDNHITTPILVMNPSEEAFETLLEKNLEPEIYSHKILRELAVFLDGRPCKVHLKLDTGMHRLGFEEQDINVVIQILKENPNLEVASIFSHLAGSDEAALDEFSKRQAERFLAMATTIKNELQISPLLHLLNSSGILRLPQLQLNMVRLGIGLYGVDPSNQFTGLLKPAATLKTVISQVKKVGKGETIGYGRKGKVEREKTIATVAIGYADGYSRAFSQGKGFMLIGGKRAPVIGNVCMDMTMVDTTGIPAKEGDEVVVFGENLPLQEVAGWIDTIPYEILTSTSERVKRVFVAESI